MCLCDYLENSPVKCFYKISFYKTEYEIDNNQTGVVYLNHDSKIFKVGDSLPLKTNYYKYPSNFIIYDYISNESIFHTIENDVYTGSHNINDNTFNLNKFKYIFSSNGLEILNINSIKDFENISNEWIKTKEEHTEIRNKYFPDGTVSMFMHNPVKYNQLRHQFEEEANLLLDSFKEKWVKEDKYCIEKKYAVLLEAVKNLYWDLKNGDLELTKENKHLLSLAYEEFEVFSYLNPDAQERFFRFFDDVPKFYVSNITSMVESFME